MKKIISVFLILITAFAFSLSACNFKSLDSEVVKTSASFDEDVIDTDNVIIDNAQSDLVVVIPSDPITLDYNGANEFVYFIKQATGALLEIKKESEISNSQKGFFFGETEKGNSLNVSHGVEELSSQGFKIITDDDGNTYVLGGGNFGTLFGVYELLNIYINWDCIAEDEIVFDKTSKLTFKNINRTSIPDIEYRVSGNVQTYNDNQIAYRFRFIRAYGNGFMVVNGQLYHNSTSFLDPSIYNRPTIKDGENEIPNPDYNPDFYSQAGITGKQDVQLCYTGHADTNPEARDKMLELSLEELKKAVLANPDIDNVQFSLSDNDSWCDCDACRREKAKYGTNSAVVIKFCNDLHRKLNDWLVQEGINRKINLVFFAYLETTDAPVIENDDGTFSPYDDEVKCDGGVYVFYAPVYANYTVPFSDDENYGYYELLSKWSAVSDEVFLWTYSTNFATYFSPYNTFNSMRENIRIAKEFNIKYLFDEGQHYASTPKPTGFTYLKEYLLSKAMWDSECDLSAYTDKFFKYYFKDASDVMRMYYNELRLHFNTIEKEIGGGIFEHVETSTELWKRATLTQWLNYFDIAYQKIEKYKKTDSELYQKLYNRINIESLAVRYLYINLYGIDDMSDDMMEMKRAFKDDVVRYGFTEQGQGQSIDVLWPSWGIE